MSLEALPSERSVPSASRDHITLSKWVNERFPPWDQLLSAHDVARLTRRPRWILLGMVLLGRFPRKHCFHGRRIAWLRRDVLDWMGDRPSVDLSLAPFLRWKLSRFEVTGAGTVRQSRTAFTQAERVTSEPFGATQGLPPPRRSIGDVSPCEARRRRNPCSTCVAGGR